MGYKLIQSPEKPSFMRFLKRTFALDLLKGLKITLKELFLPKTIATLKYPLEKNPLSTRYRAIHKLMRLLGSGNERCIGCGLCEKICISNCIKIETAYGADSRKKITSYTINFGRCIYCGLCAEVCPEIAIIHGERYENATEQRAHFANKGTMLTPLDLALRGDICEFDGYGAVSENADSCVKWTPTGYVGNLSLDKHSAVIPSVVDSANAESNQNQSCDSTESRPLRGAKNQEQGCSSATADFLLEAEKRGSPPKSEKRELLARRGSGAGGAALLREDSSESNAKSGESSADSPLNHCDSNNLTPCDLDSSLRTSCSAQNDKVGVDSMPQDNALTQKDSLC